MLNEPHSETSTVTQSALHTVNQMTTVQWGIFAGIAAISELTPTCATVSSWLIGHGIRLAAWRIERGRTAQHQDV